MIAHMSRVGERPGAAGGKGKKGSKTGVRGCWAKQTPHQVLADE